MLSAKTTKHVKHDYKCVGLVLELRFRLGCDIAYCFAPSINQSINQSA